MSAGVASSVRGLNRRYGVSRDFIYDAIARGELPAARIGKRRFLVLHRDFESYLRSLAIRPTSSAEAFVERRLAMDGARRVGATESLNDT